MERWGEGEYIDGYGGIRKVVSKGKRGKKIQ